MTRPSSCSNASSNLVSKRKSLRGGGLIFGGTKKKNKEAFNASVHNFCKVTRDGNNLPKGQRVTRRLIHEVCSSFYELEDESGFFGGIFKFAFGILKKPVELIKSGIHKVSSSTESLSGTKKRVQPLEN